MAVNDNVLELNRLLDQVNVSLKEQKTNLDATAGSLEKYNKQLASVPSQFNNMQADLVAKAEEVRKSDEKAIVLAEKKAAAVERANERARLSEIKLQQQREKSFDNFAKNQTKEQQVLERSETAYNRIQASVNVLIKTYQDLAIRKQLGNTLSIKEEAQLSSITGRLNLYQTALKKVDADIQKHTRNVGNYASGFNPLGAAIGQISREIPNFAQSVQIGILSLTNNIGQLQDAIGGIVAQNKILESEGKTTKSVMSQIGAQILTFNTLLYLGVAAFSAYGSEIGDWIEKLFDGDAALKSITESQQAFNKSKVEGQKAVVAEALVIKSNLAIAADETLKTVEREISLKQIRESNAKYYFKDLTDREILTGKTTEAEAAYAKALNASGEAAKANDQIVKNKQRLLELSVEEARYQTSVNKLQKESTDLRERANAALGNEERSALTSLAVSKERQLNSFIAQRAINQKEVNGLTKDNLDNTERILKLQKDAIGLQYDDDKDKAGRDKQYKDLADFLASQYELIKKQNEAQALLYEKIYNDEKENFDQRLQALSNYNALRQTMSNNEREESLRLLKLELDSEVDEIQRSIRKGTIARENGLAVIASLYKKYGIDVNIVEQENNDRFLALTEKTSKEAAEIIKKRYDIILETEKIYSTQQQALFKKTSDNEKLSVEIRQEAFRAYIALKQKQIDIDKSAALAAAGNNKEEIAQIQARYAGIQDLLNKEKTNESPFAKSVDQANAALQNLAKTMSSDAFNEAGLSSFQKYFDGSFKKIIDGFDLIEDKATRSAKKFAYTYAAIAESVKEAFEFINNMQAENFDAQYVRLDEQKELALAFEGQTAEGRAEIERQYDDRRKSIQRDQAAAQKKQALFGIAITTSQAAVLAYASQLIPGDPTSIIRAQIAALIAVGVGLAQAAVVASQPVPEYFSGRDGGGAEWAKVDERGAEIHTDSKGNIKSFGSDKGANYRYLEEGDKIFTHEKSMDMLSHSRELDDILIQRDINGYSVNLQAQRIDYDKMEQAVGNAVQRIPKGKTLIINKDARGERIYEQENGRTTELLNAKLKGKGETF